MGRTSRLPKLIVIADEFTRPDSAKKVIDLVRNAELDWIQLRDHTATSRDFDASCRMLCSTIPTESPGTKISINSSLELASELNTGLHVGFRGPSPVTARSKMGPDVLLGYSVHEASDVTDAVAETVDYLMLGPVFNPISKNGVTGAGLALLKRITQMTTLPVFAVGGITADQIPECIEAGAYGVATIGGVMHAPDPAAAVRTYQMTLHDAANH